MNSKKSMETLIEKANFPFIGEYGWNSFLLKIILVKNFPKKSFTIFFIYCIERHTVKASEADTLTDCKTDP